MMHCGKIQLGKDKKICKQFQNDRNDQVDTLLPKNHKRFSATYILERILTIRYFIKLLRTPSGTTLRFLIGIGWNTKLFVFCVFKIPELSALNQKVDALPCVARILTSGDPNEYNYSILSSP